MRTQAQAEALAKIAEMFKPHPHIKPGPLDAKFELRPRDEADHLAVDIYQFIFRRATIVIPPDAKAFTLSTWAEEDQGELDMQALHKALVHDGYVTSKQEGMVQLFTMAKKQKPHKRIGLSRKAKRNAKR